MSLSPDSCAALAVLRRVLLPRLSRAQPAGSMAAIKALELWCKAQCEGYRDVVVTNMTTSFRNGLAFCALIHKYRPDLIDYDSLRKEDVFENNSLAFQVAEEKLGIPALLDAEDMVALRVPDRLSILTYVSQYYNYFKGRPPMGGVKRPAEGSKEEPSEKKNLPVVARTATEKRPPSTRGPQASPRPARAAPQKAASAESANKNGTLSSRCVVCKSHVHLVQRHLVEGKLYHRSCFKCSECSGVLHAGSCKPGKDPDVFICDSHQGAAKPPPTENRAGIRPAASASRPARASEPPAKPSSVPTAPLSAVLKPSAPAPGRPRPLPPGRDGDENRAKVASGKKLAEQNFNNNNKRLFTIRSAERRFGEEPSPADRLNFRGRHGSQGPAGNGAGRAPTGHGNHRPTAYLKTADKDDTRPATAPNAAKDAAFTDWNTKLKPAQSELRLKDADTFLEQQAPALTATVPPVALRQPHPAPFKEVGPQKPPEGPESLGFKHAIRSPVKSPPRQPTEASISSPPTAANHGNPSAAKKGKYLSPTNASEPEMRSPSLASRHVPAEQIERELEDIEWNVAQLEKEGVELEKRLRSCEEGGEGDMMMDPLMVDWFNLIRKKQVYIRKESELVYLARTQELERQQPGVEGELRRLMEKPDHLKSSEEKRRERKLMERLMEIVDGRNTIVEVLDKDRLREVEEDEQLNTMMQNLGVKRAKSKRKSSLSKLFRRRSKRRVE